MSGGNDPYPLISRTARCSDYAEGGLSFLEKRTNARTSGTVSITQRVKAARLPRVQGGSRRRVRDATTHTSATPAAQRWRRSANTAAGAPGRWQLREFYKRRAQPDAAERMDPDSVDARRGRDAVRERPRGLPARRRAARPTRPTATIGAYLQDSWQIRPNFTLNARRPLGAADRLRRRGAPGHRVAGRRDRPGRRRTSSTTWSRRASASSTTRPAKVSRSCSATTAGSTRTCRWTSTSARSVARSSTSDTSTSTAARRQPGWLRPELRRRPHAGHDGSADSSSASNMCAGPRAAGAPRWWLRVRVARASRASARTRSSSVPSTRSCRTSRSARTTSIARCRSSSRTSRSDGGNNYLITNPGQNFDAEAADARTRKRER